MKFGATGSRRGRFEPRQPTGLTFGVREKLSADSGHKAAGDGFGGLEQLESQGFMLLGQANDLNYALVCYLGVAQESAQTEFVLTEETGAQSAHAGQTQAVAAGAEMISGVRASSMRILSTSSTMA